MSGTEIEHTNYLSLYKDGSSDFMERNDDAAKVEKLAKYLHPWRTKDGPPGERQLKQIVCDHFADHNVGRIGVLVAEPGLIPVLKTFVGLKKYTSDPSSPSSTLFGHHYRYVADVKENNGEINKFDWECLAMTSEVNVFKEKHHKTKLEDNPDTLIFPPVTEDNVQRETLCVHKAMYIPFCLMSLVLDKDLNPRETFLFVHDTINAAKLSCCQDLLDFRRVAGTFAEEGDALPVVARDIAGNVTAVSINRPLIRSMKTKVVRRDL